MIYVPFSTGYLTLKYACEQAYMAIFEREGAKMSVSLGSVIGSSLDKRQLYPNLDVECVFSGWDPWGH